MRIRFLFCFLVLLVPVLSQGQTAAPKETIIFDEIYDEPYSLNKLFIQIQPFYGEMFVTNVNAGFGLEAHYYLDNRANFQASFRKTYSQKFFDFSRDLAAKNSNMSNQPENFNYFELGGTYHIKDFDTRGTTKMVLYRKSYKRNAWASKVPMVAEVPATLRQIYGARLGGIFWDSSVDLNRALAAQNLTNAALVDAVGNGMPLTYQDEFGRTYDVSVFSNMYSRGLYVGASLTRIRNIAVSIERYESAVDDGIFTAFFDIMVAPGIRVDDVIYQGTTYSTAAMNLRSVGMRAGIEGRFNRAVSWAYGAEIGYRPSFEGRSFYALFKMSFPVFSSNLDNKVESFQK